MKGCGTARQQGKKKIRRLSDTTEKEIPEKVKIPQGKKTHFVLNHKVGEKNEKKTSGADTDIATNIINKGLIFSICKLLVTIAKKSSKISNIQTIGKG